MAELGVEEPQVQKEHSGYQVAHRLKGGNGSREAGQKVEDSERAPWERE